MGSSRSCWNGTSALQPEKITSKGTRVSCVYYQQTYEKSLETYRMHLVYNEHTKTTVNHLNHHSGIRERVKQLQ